MKTTSKFFISFLSLLMVLSLAFVPASQTAVIAVTGINSVSLTTLFSTIASAPVVNDSGSQLKSISVANVFDYPVVQQPSGNDGYISTSSKTLTQFAMASNYGSIGILAHNYLAGRYFSSLSSGNIIKVSFSDGSTKNYTISNIKKYQALSPIDPYSQFVDLDDSSTTISSTDLFMNTFGLGGALVLQTCISKNGNSSWGRLFVIAYAS